MALVKKVEGAEVFVGKLSCGGDLLGEITEFCIQKGIRLGWIQALGAVQKASLGFYNQEKREYEYFALDQPLELTELVGNVSLKDGTPFVHVHVTLADDRGTCYGGHLAPGTVVFACEVVVQAFQGPAFERMYDEETGLALWKMAETD